MTERQIQVPAAVAQLLGNEGVLAVTRYDLALAAWRVYHRKEIDGITIRKQRNELDPSTFSRVEFQLINNGVLRPIPGLPSGGAYMLIGANISDPRVLACVIDPFCYVSHLSAMEFHGLTDRLPEYLYLSSPAPVQWRRFAEDRMKRDFEDDYSRYMEIPLPRLQRNNAEKIGGRAVHLFKSAHLGAFTQIKDQHIRVATVGRTFLDMLRDPYLCGGITHVLNVYREHAALNFRLISDELEQHGKAIDKVRAGFILENVCGLENSQIDSWVKFKQRGGSRKLDPTAEYSSNFSARWDLSINALTGSTWEN